MKILNLPFLILINLQINTLISFGYTSQKFHVKYRKFYDNIPDNEYSVNRDELKRALQIAQEQDSEWFIKVFGNKFPDFLSSNTDTKEENDENDENENYVDDYDKKNKNTININQESNDSQLFSDNLNSELKNLGYLMSDIYKLKDTVKIVLVEKSIPKPKRGIPNEWLLDTEKEMTRDSRSDKNKSEYSSSRGNDYSESDKQSSKPSQSSVNKKRLRKIYDDDDSETGSTFNWKGTPPTSNEFQKRIGAQDSIERENDLTDEISESISFWPGKEEFKDMLIEESKARIELAGPWIKPLVKQEAKWRYGIYKTFLDFVGYGLEDPFEVEPLGFGLGSEEQRGNGNGNGNGNPSKTSKSSKKAQSYNAWIEKTIEKDDGWVDSSDLPFQDFQNFQDTEQFSKDLNSPVDKSNWFTEVDSDKDTTSNNWKLTWFDSDDSSFDKLRDGEDLFPERRENYIDNEDYEKPSNKLKNKNPKLKNSKNLYPDESDEY